MWLFFWQPLFYGVKVVKVFFLLMRSKCLFFGTVFGGPLKRQTQVYGFPGPPIPQSHSTGKRLFFRQTSSRVGSRYPTAQKKTEKLPLCGFVVLWFVCVLFLVVS